MTKTIPSLASMVGLKVEHGSPGYEEPEVIKDVTFNNANDRVKIFFESGFVTNMTEYELDVFMDDGEVHYYQHFAGPHDKGLATMKAY